MAQPDLRPPQAEADEARLPPVGAIVADKYKIVRLIGRGGTGAVFQAGHLVTGKQVALKYLVPRGAPSPDDIARFIREARTAGRIAHPNIVDIYDVGEHEGSFFLVMELLRGRPLRDWMRAGALEPGPLLRSLLPALRGVRAAHRAGVVHRDLKPENVFLCSDHDGELLTAKVLDFGISKVRDGAGLTLSSITHTGVVMGTPWYMSPEQAEDSSSVDRRTDIYACGVMLYEALSGTLPYRAEGLTALLQRIARGDALPLRKLRRDLPPALESAVMRAMARDPGDRFADMRALIAALEPFAGERPLPVAPDAVESGGWLAGRVPAEPGTADNSERRRVQRTWLVAGVAAAAVAIGGLIALRWMRATPESAAAVEPGTAVVGSTAVEPGTAVVNEWVEPPASTPAIVPRPEPVPEIAPAPERAATPPVGAPRPAKARERAGVEPERAVPAAESRVPALETAAPAQPAAPAPQEKIGVEMRSDQF